MWSNFVGGEQCKTRKDFAGKRPGTLPNLGLQKTRGMGLTGEKEIHLSWGLNSGLVLAR
jgi:hypothetical protein